MMRKCLLWMDDDGAERFANEVLRLEDAGWDVTWVRDIREAVGELAGRRWDAVILDQDCPYVRPESGDGGPPGLWGGAVTLWWLRRPNMPALPPQLPSQLLPPPELFSRPPHPDNVGVCFVIVSAKFDATVLECLRGADPRDESLEIVAKPVSVYFEQLMEKLA